MVEYIQPIYENPAARFERRGSALVCKKFLFRLSVQKFRRRKISVARFRLCKTILFPCRLF